MPDTTAVLEFDGVSKAFGATQALRGITAKIQRGEIVGLLGHNGAGKSTLMNIISGATRGWSGSIRINGQDLLPGATPAETQRRGVTVIHQEPALAPNLTVFENLTLTLGPGARRRDLRRRATLTLREVGIAHLMDVVVSALQIGERQLVELCRGVMAGGVQLLLLDEPTAALGHEETVALHRLIRTLANRGVAVVYISHRLPDIFEVCTRIAVLRGGEVVMDDDASRFTSESLSEALAPGAGREEFAPSTPGDPVVEVDYAGVAIRARAGEVVGLFGMAAGPQFALLDALSGAAHSSTRFTLRGRPHRVRTPAEAIALGVHSVPADRERDGLLPSLPALDNVRLPWLGRTLGRGWWVDRRTGAASYNAARKLLNVHGPGPDAEIEQFSGGNRQKHLIARWLLVEEPAVLLLQQPTQGVDIGAKRDIVRAVRAASSRGATILVASAETDEIASLCDRSYVLTRDHATSVPRSASFQSLLLQTLLSPFPRPPRSVEPVPGAFTI